MELKKEVNELLAEMEASTLQMSGGRNFMKTLNPGKIIWQDIERIRAERPLVHNITNYVVMNTTANALLAIGALPVMAHAIEEVEEMVSLARALVINIGTLSTPWVQAMIKAGKKARRRRSRSCWIRWGAERHDSGQPWRKN